MTAEFTLPDSRAFCAPVLVSMAVVSSVFHHTSLCITTQLVKCIPVGANLSGYVVWFKFDVKLQQMVAVTES